MTEKEMVKFLLNLVNEVNELRALVSATAAVLREEGYRSAAGTIEKVAAEVRTELPCINMPTDA